MKRQKHNTVSEKYTQCIICLSFYKVYDLFLSKKMKSNKIRKPFNNIYFLKKKKMKRKIHFRCNVKINNAFFGTIVFMPFD